MCLHTTSSWFLLWMIGGCLSLFQTNINLCICVLNPIAFYFSTAFFSHYSLSSAHEIIQARLLEWVVIPVPRGSKWPRHWTRVSHTAGGFFTIWVTRETHPLFYVIQLLFLYYIISFITKQWINLFNIKKKANERIKKL